jgi:hypothetical protein
VQVISGLQQLTKKFLDFIEFEIPSHFSENPFSTILGLGTGWNLVLGFKPRPLYPRGNRRSPKISTEFKSFTNFKLETLINNI